MRSNIVRFFVLLFCFYSILLVVDIFFANKVRSNNSPPGFNEQFLHPYYFFFFPTRNRALLDRMNSDKNWVSVEGWRGEGPEAKGNRKLAFLLGGSTAFGDGASTNKNTITANLNKIQNDFHFVNAGVPSWNSHQELLRVLKQILPENPNIIIHLNGFNDVIISLRRRGFDLPPDAPESFEDLDRWVENIRDKNFHKKVNWELIKNTPIFQHLFLTHMFSKDAFIDSKLIDIQRRNSLEYEPLIEETAKLYLSNMDLVHEICLGRKIKFFVFLQPNKFHNKFYQSRPDESMWYQDFVKKVMGSNSGYFIDISDPFPEFKNEEEVNGIFRDPVHLTDAGYEKLAGVICKELLTR